MQKKYNQLSNIAKELTEEFSLTPIFGAELEFYLSPNIDIQHLSSHINYNLVSEKGINQYEINFAPSGQIASLALEISATRKNIISYCSKNSGWADFTSKPFIEDYGSSMHIHLNFLEDADIEKYIFILCDKIDDYIKYLLPHHDDYNRLDNNFMAPTHVSWGGNNRSVMIRIPGCAPKRLEHRLPSSNADPALVFKAILEIIQLALRSNQKISQLPKIYGNGFDSQYNMRKILPRQI